jgi:hypothetical protein
VAARNVGSVSLCYAATTNAQTFGIVAHVIAKMSYKDTSGALSKASMLAPTDTVTIGSFEILIV